LAIKKQKTNRFLTYFGEAQPDTDELGPVGHEDGHRVALDESLRQEEVRHPEYEYEYERRKSHCGNSYGTKIDVCNPNMYGTL
jgi:hypothetical protein